MVPISNDDFYALSNLSSWFEGNDRTIMFPKDTVNLCIDVGLAGDAPQSAKYLKWSDKNFVIGIEPVSQNWRTIVGRSLFDTVSNTHYAEAAPANWPIVCLSTNRIMERGISVSEINGRFLPVRAAIANVEVPQIREIYVFPGNGGISSLDKRFTAEAASGEELVEELVPVCSLSFLLDHVSWPKDSRITCLKVDAEGFDVEVILSLKGYINKVELLTFEYSHLPVNQYRKVMGLLGNMGFIKKWDDGGNIHLVRKGCEFDIHLNSENLHNLIHTL